MRAALQGDRLGRVVGVIVSTRPTLTFVPVDDEASWVIDRRIENGRYRWSARLHLDGVRRSERADEMAAQGRIG